MHRYSSILIPHSVYHFPVRIASMTGCYVFYEGWEWDLMA